MKRFFTSEAVSEGHPDKVADQISDAILDAYLRQDENAHVACETLVTTGLVFLAGEIKSTATIDTDDIVRSVIKRIGYTNVDCGFDASSCAIINTMHKQSPDIARGVDANNEKLQGAGDQGIMFGYANDETATQMPLAYYLANLIVKTLSEIRKEGRQMLYLRPDSKSQVTIEYDDNDAVRIDTIVVSTQHEEFASESAMQDTIKHDIINIVIPRVKDNIKDANVLNMIDDKIKYLVNPTGKFVIGGPHGDTGLTGRKIIVDTYGGYVAHGGGAFSGKDPSKVDRSAAYAARFIAKNMVANKIAKMITVQLGYAIGVPEPVSIFVDGRDYTDGWNNAKVEQFIKERFNLTPYSIINGLSLRKPIYEATAAYGHFGRKCEEKDGVILFPWEKVYDMDNLTLNYE